MRHITSALCIGISAFAFAQTISPEQLLQSANQMNEAASQAEDMLESNMALADSISTDSISMDSIVFEPVRIRELDEILESLPDTMPNLYTIRLSDHGCSQVIEPRKREVSTN